MSLISRPKQAFVAVAIFATAGMGTALASDKAPGAGDRAKDGTVYVGISPDTKQPFYAAPADLKGGRSKFTEPTTLFVFEAEQACRDYKLGTLQGFRVPTKAELNVLYQNKEKGALRGTFSRGVRTPDYYVSSTPVQGGGAQWKWVQYFRNGATDQAGGENDVPVRCVRDTKPVK